MEIRKIKNENYESNQGAGAPLANPNPPSQLFGDEPVNTNLNTGLFADSELKGYELKAAAAGTAFENAQTNYDTAVSADGIADGAVNLASDFADMAQSNVDDSEMAAKNADTNLTNAQAAVDTAQMTLGSLTAGLGAAQTKLSVAKDRLSVAKSNEDEGAIAAANQMVQGTEQQIAEINAQIREAKEALSEKVQEAADAQAAKIDADKDLLAAEIVKSGADKALDFAQDVKTGTEAKVVETEAALKTAQEDKQAADAEYNEAIQRAEEKARQEAAAAEEKARQETEAIKASQVSQDNGSNPYAQNDGIANQGIRDEVASSNNDAEESGDKDGNQKEEENDTETSTVTNQTIAGEEEEKEEASEEPGNEPEDDGNPTSSDVTIPTEEEKEEASEEPGNEPEDDGNPTSSDVTIPTEEEKEQKEDVESEDVTIPTEEEKEQKEDVKSEDEIQVDAGEKAQDSPIQVVPKNEEAKEEQPAESVIEEPVQPPVESAPEIQSVVVSEPVMDTPTIPEPTPTPPVEVVQDVQPTASQTEVEPASREDAKTDTSKIDKVVDYDDPGYIPSSFDEVIKHDLVISDETMANSLAKVLDLDCSPEIVSDAVGLSTKEAIATLYESQQATLYDTGYVTKVSKNTDTATVDEHRNAESDFWDSFASATEIMMKKTNKGDIDTSEITSVQTSDINDNELLASENSTYDAARNISKRITEGQYVIPKELTDITRKFVSFVVAHQDDSNDAGGSNSDLQKKKDEKK